MDCHFVRGAGNHDSIKSRSGTVKPVPAALVRAALKSFEPCYLFTNKKAPLLGCFLAGAGNRTRTCTLSQWNLNPPSLPIPPCPRVFDFIMGPDFCQCINARLRIAQTAHFFLPSLLTFPLVIAKIDSVWCTLPQSLSGVLRFIDNRRFAGVCVLRPMAFCFDFGWVLPGFFSCN